jgi:putative ABC transport system permease protein
LVVTREHRRGTGARPRRLRARNPLWTKAPVVLFRFPGLLAALVIGALLLSLAAAASPLFLAATSSGQVKSEIGLGVVTRYGAGIAYVTKDQRLNLFIPGVGHVRSRQEQLFTERVLQSPYLDPPIRSVLGPIVTLSTAEGRPRGGPRVGRIFAREGALGHIKVVEGKEGPGVWLPTHIAAMGVGPGDHVLMSFEGNTPVKVSVDGVYRALYQQPRQGFWRAWVGYIYSACPSESRCPIPPQFVIADLEDATRLTARLGSDSATFGWEAPVLAGRELTLDQARQVQAFVQRFQDDMSDRNGELWEVFRCCGRQYEESDEDDIFQFFLRSNAEYTSNITRVVSEVDKRMTTIEGPVQLLLAAGLVVAAAVVAGAGAFAMATRRVEATYLFARGRSPLTMGAKATIEAFLPGLIGSAAGLGVAFLLVKAIGPGGPVGQAALRTAALSAAVAVPASALLVGGVSAISFLRQSEHHRARLGLVARFPWELTLLGASVWLLTRLYSGGAFVDVPGLRVERPSAALLLFPVLLVGGAAMLAARAFRLGLGWLRPRTDRLSPATYLAANRLAGGPKLAVLLFAASALCLGVFVHAQTVVDSLETTIDGKAKLFVGSDVQVQVDADYPAPRNFPLPVTKVTRVRSAGKFAGTDRRFDLLAVDPATLPSVAYWRDRFGDGRSLEALVGLLERESGEDLPIIVSGGDVPDRVVLDIAQQRVSAVVAAETQTFPGTFSREPLVVIDAAELEAVYGGEAFRISNSSSELWVKGDEKRGLDALAELGLPPYSMLAASTVKDIPSFAGVINTFSVLNILALGAGALVVVVMVMYLQARQRAQVVAYALSRRMGLRDRSYRRSLVLELAGMLGISYLVGVILSLVASLFVVPVLDPLSTIPPEPLFTFPAIVVIAAALALVAVSWVGGWLTNRQARRSNLAEVMRLAE